MKRRDFLTKLGAGYLAAGSLLFENPFKPRFRIARAANGKVLIVIFQKGGCDGLNTVVPYGDPDYYNYRPTIAVAAPGGGPSSAIDIDGFFGLHPSLASFEPIYAAGDMAIMPTVQYPNAIRSHFEGQLFMQSGTIDAQPFYDGWLNRHLISQPAGASALRAAGFADGEDAGLPDALRGQAVVSTFSDLTTFGLGLPEQEETDLLQRLTPIYDQAGDASKFYSQLVHDYGRAVIDDVGIINGIDVDAYVPANNALYPASKLGQSMRQTAQLIKEGVGLEIAALTRHSWDHHEYQGGGEAGGKQSKLHSDFSRSIAALYTDLGPLMSDVVILTMTEFGRTARENASFGTDHGNAAAWFAIGPSVNGGMHLGGGWPGLATANLRDDRDLAHTIDYRDVMAEVVSRHLGNNDLAAVLPGHTYSPVDFLPA